jgi:hypothetical protein
VVRRSHGDDGRSGSRRGPTRATIWRRRLAALVVLAAAGGDSGSSPEGKLEPGGYWLVHNEVHSKAVKGRELGFNVIVPPKLPRRGHRALIVYLHGRGGYEGTFNEAVLRGYVSLHGHGPLVVFRAGGVHGAVGGHSPALWFQGSETAPGAFDDLADFERNDVVGKVEADPDACRSHRPLLAGRPRRLMLGRPLARLPALVRKAARALPVSSHLPDAMRG